jgi:formate dehydrogenase subunit delta
MDIDRLVAMVNDIAAYFAAEPDQEAAAQQVGQHLRRFWEPRMRSAICSYVEADGAGLSPLARRGVECL